MGTLIPKSKSGKLLFFVVSFVAVFIVLGFFSSFVSNVYYATMGVPTTGQVLSREDPHFGGRYTQPTKFLIQVEAPANKSVWVSSKVKPNGVRPMTGDIVPMMAARNGSGATLGTARDILMQYVWYTLLFAAIIIFSLWYSKRQARVKSNRKHKTSSGM